MAYEHHVSTTELNGVKPQGQALWKRISVHQQKMVVAHPRPARPKRWRTVKTNSRGADWTGITCLEKEIERKRI